MAVASTAPIQIGRYRSPELSLSNTIGCWLGTSTRTPTRFSSIIGSPTSLYPWSPDPATGSGAGAPGDGQIPVQRCGVRGQVGLIIDSDDERKVSVALQVVQSITHHEPVGTIEPAIPNVQWGDAPDALVQKRADLHRGSLAGGQGGEEIGERQPGIDDVLHDQDVLPSDVVIEVLQDPNHPRALGVACVRRDRHE